MNLERKISNTKVPENVDNQSYGFMEKIRSSKPYKALGGALATLGLMYAVNTANLNGKVNTASAEQAEASVPYKELHLDNEDTFKDKIEDSGLCWVMYTFDDVKPEYQERGQYFWEKLQKQIGGQVDFYIVVDTTNWDEDAKDLSKKEIGKNKYPSFVMYKNGNMYSDENGNNFRITGAPPKEESKNLITYIKKNIPKN